MARAHLPTHTLHFTILCYILLRCGPSTGKGSSVSTGDPMNDGLWRMLADELAERLAERLAPHLAKLVSPAPAPSSPWLTTTQAIAYSGLPEGTFRKLAACGKIPSHGGRTKLFYQPELDQALLEFSGSAEEERRLRRIR